ncbi:uncharacterized protein [Clytia hemisphaerica]
METVFKWHGIINIGESVNKQLHWKSKKGTLRYRRGYTCKRTFSKDQSYYEIFAEINESNLKKPLFVIKIYNRTYVNDEIEMLLEKTISCFNPTAAYKKLLNYLNVEIKGTLVGNAFYGFYKDEFHKQANDNDTQTYQNAPNYCNDANDTNKENSSDASTAPFQSCATSSCRSRISNWIGVLDFGVRINEDAFIKKVGTKNLYLQPGYHALRSVKTTNGKFINLHLKIINVDNQPKYCAFTEEDPVMSFESHIPKECVSQALDGVKAIKSKKNWSAIEYFGLQKSEVQQKLTAECDKLLQDLQPGEISDDDDDDDNEKDTNDQINEAPLLLNVLNIRKRNAGPTSSLCPKAIKARNEIIHNLVRYTSFGDVKSFVQHLIVNCPDIIDSALDLEFHEKALCRIVSKLNLHTLPKTLDEKDTAEMLIGKADISQRGYGNIRNILAAKSVKIPSYTNVKQYVNKLNVGKIVPIHHENESTCNCMGYFCTVKETLQMILSCPSLYSKMIFFSIEQCNAIKEFIISKDAELYKNFDSTRRTIIIRDTGDNFRASSKYPTEQTSFSILNIEELVTCPYGQFISTLWRGKESRETLQLHVSKIYEELTHLVKNGVKLKIDNAEEHFNIIVISVADLSFTKEVLGKCQCTHTFGCLHCELDNKQWCSLKPTKGTPQSYRKMITRGKKAFKDLGSNPDKNSAPYKKFTATHFAQWAPVLFEGTIIEFTPPCGLHMILAHHRYLWKFLHETITRRTQQHLLPVALRKIGCTYLAFQIESYQKSKKKSYDGSDTLKMIGNDCKLMEQNIDSFLDVFVQDREQSWQSQKASSLRHVLKLYQLFTDIARDLRAIHADKERISTFQERVESFVQIFLKHSPNIMYEKMPYLHYLRNHVGDLMKLYMRLFNWGYGYFSTNAGEHLNKRIKQTELSHTNMDEKRFFTIMHIFRTKQFEFTHSIMPSKSKPITCSACNQQGHNKKNKSCPMHPSHPPLVFDETDDETEDV